MPKQHENRGQYEKVIEHSMEKVVAHWSMTRMRDQVLKGCDSMCYFPFHIA